MRIYHRTSARAADRIIRGRTVEACADASGYDVNSGPFFFVEGLPEVELATGPNCHEVVLEFECHLPETRRDRNAQHTRDINAGRIGDMRGKLVLEYNPVLPGEMMQARIFPEEARCLTFTGFRTTHTGWWTRRRWDGERLRRPLFSIGFRS